MNNIKGINSNDQFHLNDSNRKEKRPDHQKAVYLIKAYLDILIERMNYFYLNIPPLSNQNLNCDLFHYHTLYYNELNNCDLSSSDLYSYQMLLKTIALLNDKVENLEAKLNNDKKYISEIKRKYKEINKKDFNYPLLPEINEEDVANLNIKTLIENNNKIKDSIKSKFSDIKQILKTNKTKLNKETDSTNKSIKGIFLENEFKRINDENLSLKLELNLIYRQLKEENKLYQIQYKPKEEEIDSLICFEVKEGIKDEQWLISRNFIKSLKNSEFYINYT